MGNLVSQHSIMTCPMPNCLIINRHWGQGGVKLVWYDVCGFNSDLWHVPWQRCLEGLDLRLRRPNTCTQPEPPKPIKMTHCWVAFRIEAYSSKHMQTWVKNSQWWVQQVGSWANKHIHGMVHKMNIKHMQGSPYKNIRQPSKELYVRKVVMIMQERKKKDTLRNGKISILGMINIHVTCPIKARHDVTCMDMKIAWRMSWETIDMEKTC